MSLEALKEAIQAARNGHSDLDEAETRPIEEVAGYDIWGRPNDALLSHKREMDQRFELMRDRQRLERERFETAKPLTPRQRYKKRVREIRSSEFSREELKEWINDNDRTIKALKGALKHGPELELYGRSCMMPRSTYGVVGYVSTRDLIANVLDDHDPEEFDDLDEQIHQERLDRNAEEWLAEDFDWFAMKDAPDYEGFKISPDTARSHDSLFGVKNEQRFWIEVEQGLVE